MRGTRRHRETVRPRPRIIPAHAGNTPQLVGERCPAQDHPRACGEHGLDEAVTGLQTGSAPRMRGTRSWCRTSDVRRGIIPAHAGNTILRLRLGTCAGDHPRACGEHTRFVVKSKVATGSSPRMRGTLSAFTCHGVHKGIIPAHAGNTVVGHVSYPS